MSRNTIKKFTLITLGILLCVVLISYKKARSFTSQDATDSEKCEQKRTQTDFILLESITKHLLSSTDN